MTLPRRIIEGKTYMVTRRCTQRTFLLAPSRHVNHVFEYSMAYAAEKYDIALHAFVVMSNHFHMLLTDKYANLPKFMHSLDRTVAAAMNSKYGRWENFWAPGSYSMQELRTYKDVIYKLEYILLNPVRARLVQRPGHWPGLTSVNIGFGEKRTVKRPDWFFNKKGKLPKEVTWRLVKPPMFRRTRCRDLDQEVRERVERRAKELVKEVRAKGGKFLGKKKVLKIRPLSRPWTRERRRGLSPRVSAKAKEERLKALSDLYEFHRKYRKALKRWLSGDRKVVFPCGTYKMRVFFHVACEPFEDGEPPPG